MGSSAHWAAVRATLCTAYGRTFEPTDCAALGTAFIATYGAAIK